MNKRIAVIFVALTLIAAFAVTFLVGCGDPTDTPAESTPSETPVETPKETEPKHEHSFGEWTEIKAPTCTEKGQKERACECGEKETEETEATGHSYESAVTEPTCTEKGYTTHTCTVCSDSYKDSETDAKGHSYTDVVTAPTCTEKGYTTHTCTVCSDSYKDSETDAKGHSYTDVVTAPTCTEKGYITHTCAVCSDVCVDSYVSAKGHEYKHHAAVAPTCTEKGYVKHTCTSCGDSYVDGYVDAKGHSYVEGVCHCGAKDESYVPVKKYTVTFKDYDGTVVSVQTVKEGENAKAPENPRRDGYRFIGWDKSFSNIISDVILTAVYEKLSTEPQFVVLSKDAERGDTIEITVALNNNPGISSIILSVAFDNKALTLTEVIYNSSIGGQTVLPQTMTGPIKLYWINGFANAEGDFVFATLKFKVNNDAALGNHQISLSYNEDDIYNIAEVNLPFKIVNGKIAVK